MEPRLCECCRQGQAEVMSNSSNNIHQTWGPPFSRSLYVAPCIRWPRILLYCVCCIPFEFAFEKKPMKSGRSSEWIAECERHWIEAAHIILDVIFAINCRELSLVRFMRRIRVEGPVSYNTRRCKELPRLLNYDVHGDIKEAERCVWFTRTYCTHTKWQNVSYFWFCCFFF